MAVLQTKYVNVGNIGTFVYGYYYTPSYSYGTLSNTSGGSQNSSLSSVVSGAVCEICNYGSSGNGFVQMTIKGSSSAPSATVFDTLKIAGTSFARSAASSSVSGTVRTWLWSPISSNPFGTSVGANKLVTWETTTSTPTYTLTAPTSINEGSSGTFNIATTNVSTGTSLYWSVTSPTQFTGGATGTVTTDSSGAASFSVTPTADSTTEGALTVTARIRTGSQGGTIVDSDTFVVNDTSTTPGGSGGGGQSGGSGSTGYGLEIFGPNNTSVVFGSDLRCSSIQVYDSRSYAGNSSHSFTGITDATDSAKVEVVLSSAYGTSTTSYGYARTSANGGTVTVSNTQSGARTIETVILRIG
jgi:hypothetical protein